MGSDHGALGHPPPRWAAPSPQLTCCGVWLAHQGEQCAKRHHSPLQPPPCVAAGPGCSTSLLPLGGAPPLHGAHYRFAKGDRPGTSGEALNGEPAFGNWERPRRPLLPVWPVAARWFSKKIDQHHNFTPASLLIPQPFVPRTEKSESNNFILISASQSSQSTGIARIFKHNGSVL